MAGLEQGVADKVEFRIGDIFLADYAAASVVYLYLLPELNLRLRPTLLKMKPGTRVLSNSWDMQTWTADETTTFDTTEGYLWIVPAHVGGSWQIRIKARGAVAPAELTLKQRFQRVSGEANFRKFSAKLQDVTLRGDALRFSYRDANGETFDFVGKVQGNKMSGSATSRRVRGTFEATRTSTAEVRSALNSLTTERMSVVASTKCAGRKNASSTRDMVSDCNSCWFLRSDRALSLLLRSENNSAPKVAFDAIRSLTAWRAS